MHSIYSSAYTRARARARTQSKSFRKEARHKKKKIRAPASSLPSPRPRPLREEAVVLPKVALRHVQAAEHLGHGLNLQHLLVLAGKGRPQLLLL